MKLKIISKGSAQNTYVVNAATGEAVDNVAAILWVKHADGRVYAELRLNEVAIDVATDTGYVRNSDGASADTPAAGQDTPEVVTPKASTSESKGGGK